MRKRIHVVRVPIERSLLRIGQTHYMLSLALGVALFAPFPDFQITNLEQRNVEVSSFRGSHVLVLTGFDISREEDARLLRGMSLIDTEKKPLKLIVLSTKSIEDLKSSSQEMRIRPELLFHTTNQVYRLLTGENERRHWRAFLVNQRGHLLRKWDFMNERFAQDFVTDFFRMGLQPGESPPDVRLPIIKQILEELGFTMKEEGVTYDSKNSKGQLCIFLSTTGAVDALYVKRISEIIKYCNEKDISVLGIFSNYDETIESVNSWKSLHNLKFPSLLDSTLLFADVFKATRTPECFLLNHKRQVVYCGSIDSSTWESENNRPYLKNAIDALLESKSPDIPTTMPFGTIIKRTEADERLRS